MTHFWKIYHVKNTFLENLPRSMIFLEHLPFNGFISMEMDTNGKFPCLYEPRDNSE
jgi:hypothetical protein